MPSSSVHGVVTIVAVRVLLAQQRHGGVELLGADALGAREDDGACVLDLVVEELAEVLHVHPALVRVDHGREAVERHLVGLHALHGADDVAQLADARGLDEDAVGVKLGRAPSAARRRSRPRGCSRCSRSSSR